jgi:hypothetical protein
VVATSRGKSAGASLYATSIAFAAVLSPLSAVARASGGTQTEEMGGFEIRNSMACQRVLFFTNRPQGPTVQRRTPLDPEIKPASHDPREGRCTRRPNARRQCFRMLVTHGFGAERRTIVTVERLGPERAGWRRSRNLASAGSWHACRFIREPSARSVLKRRRGRDFLVAGIRPGRERIRAPQG